MKTLGQIIDANDLTDCRKRVNGLITELEDYKKRYEAAHNELVRTTNDLTACREMANGLRKMENCKHEWVANTGRGGQPVFRGTSQVMHVLCKLCGDRTWMSEWQWGTLSNKEEPADPTMINEWHLRDKRILADALKEIYALRGEDAEIAAIVQKALREGCVPGY